MIKRISPCGEAGGPVALLSADGQHSTLPFGHAETALIPTCETDRLLGSGSSPVS